MTSPQVIDGEVMPPYWQKDYFTESSSYYGVLFFSFVGIVYSAVMLFVWVI